MEKRVRASAIERLDETLWNTLAARRAAPSAPGAPGLEHGTWLQRRYQLAERLGAGAMGVVWRAWDRELDDDVALKFLPGFLAWDGDARAHLRAEARVLLSLTHEKIVRLHTLQLDGRVPFLAMELLRGPTLAALRRERGPVGPTEALWLLAELAPALDHAHARGVTHRDVKPANVMLTAPVRERLGEPGMEAKLTDFGVAFVASECGRNTSIAPSGTLPYMAPEVLLRWKPTPASDVYSLGATLFELVAGKPPFLRGNLPRRILREPAPPLASGDARLDAAVRAALAKRPEERPRSAGELLAIALGERAAPGDRGNSLVRTLGALIRSWRRASQIRDWRDVGRHRRRAVSA